MMKGTGVSGMSVFSSENEDRENRQTANAVSSGIAAALAWDALAWEECVLTRKYVRGAL